MAITQAQREKFIRDVTPAAEAASRATGIDRNVIIAQAAHESAWGTKAKGNNYFGIKGKGQSFMTTEVINGKTVKMKQGFRTYASPMESFMDWANLMTSKARYAPVINAATPEAQIAALGASGYATDPKYASKLSSITTRVKGMFGALGDVIGFDGQLGIQGGVLGVGRKNNPEAVKSIQAMLAEAGAYDGKIDGVYGPRTEAAVKIAQEAMGVPADGKWGPQTTQAAMRDGLIASPAVNPPGSSLEARDEAYQARLLANAPKLQGTALSQTSAIPEISGTLSPVSYHSAPKRVLTAPKLGPMASAADNLAPPGIGAAAVGPSRDIAGQLQKQQEALRQGWSVQAARQIAGIDPGAVPTPRPNPRYTTSIGANSPLADPSVDRIPAPRPNFDFAVGSSHPPQRQPNFDFAVGPANAPVIGGYASAVHSAPKRVLTAPQTEMAASAEPAPDALSRTFDIMSGVSNYQPAGPKQDLSAIFDKVQAPSLPSRNVSVPQVSAVAGAPMKTTDIPASMQAGYPKAPPTLTQAQAANAARYAGLAAQYAQPPTAPAPAYQATSPIASAPIPRPNPLAAPQVMGATAAPVQQPPSAFQKLAPGMLSMAMAGGPMGMLGGFARLAAASLGNVNNPRGLGYDAATAARNAAVAAGVQSSDMIGGRMGGASYGRRQSDGTVTGTTRSGTGYSSSGGGDHISVGGRSYSKDPRGHYSLDL